MDNDFERGKFLKKNRILNAELCEKRKKIKTD